MGCIDMLLTGAFTGDPENNDKHNFIFWRFPKRKFASLLSFHVFSHCNSFCIVPQGSEKLCTY
jgi:hypothetical protein